VTPFHPDSGEVDHSWLRDHLAYLRVHGCQGIVACGTNGEAASLSVGERQAILETVLAAADGLEVVAGTGAAALPDAIKLTRHAFDAGVETVLVMPPFFFKRPSDAGITAWFARLCDAAVPPHGRVLLYHIPQLTAVPFTDGILQALLTSHGTVIAGIKDSTGDPAQGIHIRHTFPQLTYFVGNDKLVAECCLDGGAGSITACANAFPHLVRAAQTAAWGGGNHQSAQALLSAARSLLESYPLQPATKAVLTRLAGLPSTCVRPPQVELSREQEAELERGLHELLKESL
jgi:4-hydroxy-tetrahydrodipicolinate synthase